MCAISHNRAHRARLRLSVTAGNLSDEACCAVHGFHATQPPVAALPTDAILLCFALQLGGMGFVHYNNTNEEQLAHIQKVKNHTPGMIITPSVVSPSDPISKLDQQKVRPAGSLHIKPGSGMTGRFTRMTLRHMGGYVCDGGQRPLRCKLSLASERACQDAGMRSCCAVHDHT